MASNPTTITKEDVYAEIKARAEDGSYGDKAHTDLLNKIYSGLKSRSAYMNEGKLTQRGHDFLRAQFQDWKDLYGRDEEAARSTFDYYVAAILDGLREDYVRKHNSRIDEWSGAWSTLEKSVALLRSTLDDLKEAQAGVGASLNALSKIHGAPANTYAETRHAINSAIEDFEKKVPSEAELVRIFKSHVEPALKPIEEGPGSEFTAPPSLPDTLDSDIKGNPPGVVDPLAWGTINALSGGAN